MAKTVQDLIDDLKTLDPSYVVGLSRDEEGNGVNDWSGDYSLAIFNPENDSYGDRFAGYTYDDEENESLVDENTATAIVLWP